jgi:hypothetical protein
MTTKPTTKKSTLVSLAILVGVLLVGGTSGAVAHGLIGTSDLKNNAVTSPKIKDGEVKTVDLAPGARGAKNIRYPVPGSHNFAADSLLCVSLPVTGAQVRTSQWSVGMESGGLYFTLGNWGFGPSSEYRLSVDTTSPRACIFRVSGPGETYSNISIYRTIPSTVAATTVIVGKPQFRG